MSEIEQMDPLLKHEALDRTAIAGEIVENMLVNHTGIQAVPAWKAKAENIANLLAHLYQEIGNAGE